MKNFKLDKETLKRDALKLRDDLVRMEKAETKDGKEIDIYISTAAIVGAAVLVAGVTAALIISRKKKKRAQCCCECEEDYMKVEPVKIDLVDEEDIAE